MFSWRSGKLSHYEYLFRAIKPCVIGHVLKSLLNRDLSFCNVTKVTQLNQSDIFGLYGRLGSVTDAQLSQDVGHMILHRAFCQK